MAVEYVLTVRKVLQPAVVCTITFKLRLPKVVVCVDKPRGANYLIGAVDNFSMRWRFDRFADFLDNAVYYQDIGVVNDLNRILLPMLYDQAIL